MEIIIVGAGKVGKNLCRDLADENDVILVDVNSTVLEEAFSNFDIQAILGNGADILIQQEINAGNSDVFIAVTDSDEINIISCIIAKNLGAKHTIARVRSPEYQYSADFINESLGITAMINPDYEAAVRINEILQFPLAKDIENFGRGKLKVVSYVVEGHEEIVGQDLVALDEWIKGRVLVRMIERGDEVFIPRGDTVIEPGDVMYLTGSIQDLEDFFKEIDEYQKDITNTIIIGASRITYYLLQMLRHRHVRTKLIEIDPEKARTFAENFNEVVVIRGDGTDQELLLDEGFSTYEASISLTGIDEENIMVSMFANHCKMSKTITKVNRTSMLKLINYMDIGSIITPKDLVSNHIIRFIKSLQATANSSVERLYKLSDRRVEALEFEVKKSSPVTNRPLKDLKLKDDILVAVILRDQEVIYPNGDSMIEQGDQVIVFSMDDHIDVLEDILIKKKSK